MNPNMEIEGKPESDNQTINEPECKSYKNDLKIIPAMACECPMKKGDIFKYKGKIFEAYSVRERRGAKVVKIFIKMLGTLVEDESGEVIANG